jgi:apolipoprotein N-acyltransferase
LNALASSLLNPSRLTRLSGLIAPIAYTIGLHWIYISLHEYGLMPAWLAGLATVLLATYVAVYAVGAIALSQYLSPALRHWSTPWIAAAAFTLMEWLRGHLFTGFPWIAFGYLAIDTPLAGFASIVGVYGVGFAVVLCVVWALQAVTTRRWPPMVFLILTLGLGLWSSTINWTSPAGRPLRVALVQGAIPQSMKFDPAREAEALLTHLRLASIAASPGGAQLIVFPETALVRPWSMQAPETQEAFLSLAKRSGATVMLGLPMRDPDGYRNSLIAIREDNAIGEFYGRYDKHHLVPFGEFIPWGFRWFVDMMQMPLGDFQRGKPVQTPIAVKDQRVGVNICFEDLFGEELIRPIATSIPTNQHPTMLLNISNLAWFGDTIALSQHLSIARMRALETGRPMLRATNTGVTGTIDHHGDPIDLLPTSEPGLLFSQVQGMQGLTPFIRWGNWPIMIGTLTILIAALVAKRRRKSPQSA